MSWRYAWASGACGSWPSGHVAASRDEVPARPVVSQHALDTGAAGGIFRTRRPGRLVQAGATLVICQDPFGDSDQPVTAHTEGLIIGQ